MNFPDISIVSLLRSTRVAMKTLRILLLTISSRKPNWIITSCVSGSG